MKESEEITEFWNELEGEVGEKIHEFTIGENLITHGAIAKKKVGLIFVTDTRLFFQSFPREDILNSLLKTFRKRKKEDEKMEYVIPRENIKEAYIVKPKGIFGRLTASPMPLMRVELKDPPEKILEIMIMSKEKAKSLLSSLQAPA